MENKKQECSHVSKVYYKHFEGCTICPSEHVVYIETTYDLISLSHFIKEANISRLHLRICIKSGNNRYDYDKGIEELRDVFISVSQSRLQYLELTFMHMDTYIDIHEYLPNIQTTLRVHNIHTHHTLMNNTENKIIHLEISLDNIDIIYDLLNIPNLKVLSCYFKKFNEESKITHEQIKDAVEKSAIETININFDYLGQSELTLLASLLPLNKMSKLNLVPHCNNDWSGLGLALSNSTLNEIRLCMTNFRFNNDNIIPLINSIAVAQIKSFEIRFAKIDTKLCKVLACILPASKIENLAFYYCQLLEKDAIILSKGIMSMNVLNSFTFNGEYNQNITNLGVKGLVYLLNSLTNKKLKSLNLQRAGIPSKESAKAFKLLIQTNQISTLSLKEMTLNEHMIQAMVEVIPNSCIEDLDLNSSKIGNEEHYISLIDAIISSSIKTVELCGCMSEKATDYLVDSIHLSKLKNLTCHGNFSKATTDKLSRAFALTDLMVLKINGIDLLDIDEELIDNILWSNTDPRRNLRSFGIEDLCIPYYSMYHRIRLMKAYNYDVNLHGY